MDDQLGDGGMALLAELGVAFDGYGEGWATAAWCPTGRCTNPVGVVQAGVHGVVLDAACNFALLAALERGEHGVTLEMKVSNLAAARAGDELRVRGEVLRLAKQAAHLEATAYDAEDRVASRASATFLVRRRDPSS